MALVAALAVVAGGACLLSQVPRSWRLAALVFAGGIMVAATALVVAPAAAALSGTLQQVTAGDLLPGIPVVLRLDSAGAVVTLTALVAGGLTLLRPAVAPVRAATLAALAAALLAACAGSVLELTVAVGVAVVAGLWEAVADAGRSGRGAVVGFAVSLFALAGISAAALDLQASLGTTDLAAVPAGALGAGVTVPWALAALILLAGVGVGAEGNPRRRDVASVGIVPVGVVLLIRLVGAASGTLDAPTVITMVTLGLVLAVAAAARALRASADHRHTAAWGCVSLAGLVTALGCATTTADQLGFAGLAIQLELVVAAAPLWSRPHPVSLRGRVAVDVAVAQIGLLPLGVGTAAALLGLNDLLTIGGIGGRAAAAVAAWAMALLAMAAITTICASRRRSRRRSWHGEGLAPVMVSLALGIVPGYAMSHVGAALVGTYVSSPSGVTVATATGAWSGGLAVLTGIGLLLALVALAELSGRPMDATPVPVVDAGPLWRRALRPYRWMRPQLLWVGGRLGSVDAWLEVQPQFAIAVLAAVAAVIWVK